MSFKILKGRLATAGLLSLILAAGPAAAQQLVCNTPPETFTNGIPAGWSIVDSAGNGLVWGGLSVCAEPGNYTGGNFTGGTGEAACVSSSVYGSAAFDTKLVSPVFSLVGVPSASLDFNTNYQDFETADLLDVDISTNGGTSWTTLVRWNEDHGVFRDRPGEHARIDLSPFLGVSNLRVRWRYYDLTPGALDWYAQVDDVALKCAVCGPMLADPLVDRGFEAGSPSAAWTEASASFGTPLCSSARCGQAGARTGDWWASFGGVTGTAETASLQQTVVIDQGKAWLTFFLWNPESSGNGTDALRVRVDGTQVVSIPAGNSLYAAGYTRVVVDLTAYADGVSHVIRFETSTSGTPAASKFFVDDVSLTVCEPPPVSVSVSDAVGDEGHFGTRNLAFTVSLDVPSDQTVTLDYATAAAGADPKATAGTDYTATSGSLQFLPGETQKTVLVPVLGDTLDEKDESFNLSLSNVVNAGQGDVQGAGMIVDDDTATLFLDDPFVEEGNAGTAPLTFAVDMSPAADHEVTVVFRTVTGGTAAPGSDYTAVADTTIRFLPGETSKTVNVNVTGDLMDEDDETVLATLSDITGGAVFGKANGNGTILNDDPVRIRINDVSVTEGHSGTTAAVFTVTLSNSSSRTVTVDAATANGTAAAGSDYTAVATTRLTFAPTETSKTVTVPVVGDLIDENNETFSVNLTNAQNAEIEDPDFRGLGTIVDDDTSRISIADASKAEGNSGTSVLNFTVSLDRANDRTVTVQYATANGTAAAGSDYVAASGTLSFSPGQTAKTIGITINGDTVYEPNETFTVNLASPVNATILDGQAVGTITSDGDTPTIAISDASVGEASTADPVFTVSLSSPSTQQVTVNYAVADGTGLATTDYVTSSGTLTFAAGETSKTITLPLRRDDLPELAERFYVNLSAPVNALLADAQGVGTITDDDTSLATYEVNSQANGCYVLADTWNFSPSDRGAVYPNKQFNLANKFDMTFKVSLGQYDLGGGGLVWLLSPSHAVGSEDMGYDLINPSVGVEIDTAANYRSDPDEDHIAVDHNGGACCHAGHPAVQASETSPDIEDGLQHEFRIKRDPATHIMNVWFDGSLRLTYQNNLTSFIFGGNPNVYWGITGANNSNNVPSPSNVISVCPTAVCIGDTATQHVLVDDIQVSERTATTAVFKVRIFCPRSQTVTVNYATANGTALAGSDYVATSGSLTFAPGETEKTVSVTLVRDSVAESAETFFLNLSNPSINLATPDTQAVARIVD